MVEDGSSSYKMDYITFFFMKFYVLKGIQIASLVQELWQFC